MGSFLDKSSELNVVTLLDLSNIGRYFNAGVRRSIVRGVDISICRDTGISAGDKS